MSRDPVDTPDERDAKPDGGYGTGAGVSTAVATDSPGGLRRALVVAETEYRLAVRNQWAVALTAILAAFALGLTTFSGAEVSPDGFARTVASLATLAVYLVPLVALAFGYDAIVGREESGWLGALFALPISRAAVVVGAYLGRAVVLAGATTLGFGIAGASLLWEFGLAGFDVYVGFLLAATGLGLAFLAIAVFLSAIAREKAHALGLALLVWAWFVLVHDLLALGLVAAFPLPDAALSAMLVANPASVFRTLVLGGLGAAGDAGFAAALAAVGPSAGALAAALVVWIVVPIALAAVAIRTRSV